MNEKTEAQRQADIAGMGRLAVRGAACWWNGKFAAEMTGYELLAFIGMLDETLEDERLEKLR